MDSTVIAAIIQTSGTIFATLVAGYFGKRWLDQEKLKEQLKIAKDDIRFLLEVEKYYTQHTKDDDHILGKNKARDYVKEQGYKWSKKNYS